MSNYKDVALSEAQIAELKKSWKKTAWRAKALKATGKKLPDAETAKITKIDNGTFHDVETDGNGYCKTIHCSVTNRTFVFHKKNMNASDAVVSIINHDLDTDDPEYIDTVNAENADGGWLAAYVHFSMDMDYDRAKQTIAISTQTSTDVTPALFIVNVQKYEAKLASNECNALEPNPDYLNCTVFAMGDYCPVAGSEISFVRYYKGYWYTWARCGIPGGHCWQLGRFNRAGEYSLLAQFGGPPEVNGDFNPACWYPDNQPWTTHEIGSGALITGDRVYLYENVTVFEIENDELIIGNTPELDGGKYGMEAFVIRHDMATIAAGRTAIYDAVHEVDSHWDAGSGRWVADAKYAFAGVVPTDVPTPGMVRVHVTLEHEGIPHPQSSGTTVFIEGPLGTIEQGANLSTHNGNETIIGDLEAHVATFVGGPFKLGVWSYGCSHSDEFTYKYRVRVYNHPGGVLEAIGPHSTPRIIQSGDAKPPATTSVTVNGESWKSAVQVDPSGTKYTRVWSAAYEGDDEKYFLAIESEADKGLGLWVYGTRGANKLTRHDSSSSDLKFDRIGAMHAVDADHLILACDNRNAGTLDEAYVQFFDKTHETFSPYVFHADDLLWHMKCRGVWFDEETATIELMTGVDYASNQGEIWLWSMETTEGGWTRDPRKLWDGTAPDLIIGGVEPSTADALGQGNRLINPTWSQGKGMSSYRFEFDVQGYDYLPWAQSPFNENADLPGSYDGALQDGARLIVERGTWDGRAWTWLQEGQVFIVKSPSVSESGEVSMDVVGMGPISLLVKRATYEGFHKPEVETFSDVTLIKGVETDDGLPYYYESGGERITDWLLTRPQPVIKINGEVAVDYELSAREGLVFFDEEQTETVTATFDRYVPGSNEAEDIIWCILTYPQKLGGCGLDESYITRRIEGETLEADAENGRVYYFSKNNVRAEDEFNTIYRDGAEVTSGVTWNFRDGSVEFATSQSGYVITGDCVHFTIQKSGATLPPMNFVTREKESSYKCIDEVLHGVSPNYIIREGRDGKIECDFFTQKPAGEEDLVITDDDLIIQSLSSNPAYEGLATRVISFGSADLEDLPNYCQDKEVEDLLDAEGTSRGWSPTGWANPEQKNDVTDGSPHTGLYTGWGNEGYGDVKDSCSAEPDGIAMVSVDMGDEYEVSTIIIARLAQRANEGMTNPDDVQRNSIWGSKDGVAWEKLGDVFKLLPGSNIRYSAGVNYDEGTRFRFIRINLHSIGLYNWGTGIDSQIGISEIQCYPHETIKGEARLQDEDPAKALYDDSGLLGKYGMITHVARGCAADGSLNTIEKVNLDAQYTLEEIVRLVRSVEVSSPWLPGVPVYSTIKVVNKALGVSRTFFVEQRNASENGDTFSGATLP